VLEEPPNDLMRLARLRFCNQKSARRMMFLLLAIALLSTLSNADGGFRNFEELEFADEIMDDNDASLDFVRRESKLAKIMQKLGALGGFGKYSKTKDVKKKGEDKNGSEAENSAISVMRKFLGPDRR